MLLGAREAHVAAHGWEKTLEHLADLASKNDPCVETMEELFSTDSAISTNSAAPTAYPPPQRGRWADLIDDDDEA